MTMLAKPLTFLLGVVLTIVGIAGFVTGSPLIVFEVSTLHNIIHILSGVIALWAASSGHRALELFSQAPSQVDLIITDLVMPGMSGREFIERIRRFSTTMPILSISGYVRPSSDEADDEFYLRKPYTAQELLRKVKRVLSQAEVSEGSAQM